MSLKPQAVCPVPQETARVARAAYPKGNIYMQMRNVLGSLYTDEDFVALFPKEGQPAQAPWRLALVTVMQFVENLSDRQAADAVRGRIDWKYLLGLELTDAGFDASVLSEFRARLIDKHAEELLLEKMLTLFQQKGWLKARGRQRTDSTHVLAKIRALNRLLCVWETMRAALNSLAVVAPDWLRAQSQPEWVERYGPRSENSRLPAGEAERQAQAVEIGKDGVALLEALFDPTAPQWLRQVPASEILRHVWVQNYQWNDGAFGWRSSRIFPLHPVTSVLPTTKRLITARSGVPNGWDTRSTSQKVVKCACLCSLPMWKPRQLPFQMMRGRQPFMPNLTAKGCCHLSILWIRAMWTLNSWWRASGTTKLIWWVRPERTTDGKLLNKPASMPTTFSLIGKSNRPSARRNTPAAVGLRPLTTGKMR